MSLRVGRSIASDHQLFTGPFGAITVGGRRLWVRLWHLIPIAVHPGHTVLVAQIGMVRIQAGIDDPHHHALAIVALRQRSRTRMHLEHPVLHPCRIVHEPPLGQAELEMMHGLLTGQLAHSGHRHPGVHHTGSGHGHAATMPPNRIL